MLAINQGVSGIGAPVFAVNHGVSGIGAPVFASCEWVSNASRPKPPVRTKSTNTATTSHLDMNPLRVGKLTRAGVYIWWNAVKREI